MKEEIQEFRKRNGNITYTTKELIEALHVKLDKIDSKFDLKIATKLNTSIFWKVMGGLLVLFSIIVGVIK